MKQTITINIGGIAFYIDDDAYKMLESYLESIEKNLSSGTDKKEVMRDIESRIAELFQSISKQQHVDVITAEMVKIVMAQLGSPEDFKDSSDEKNQGEKDKQNSLFQKKIYRDIDNKIFGGVCSGLAHWLDINVVFVRLIFALMLLLYGVTLPVYIVLWIIMPAAQTAAQRLDMRGEETTVENIENEVKNNPSPKKNDDGCLLTMLKVCLWIVGGFFLFILLLSLGGVLLGVIGALTGLVAVSPAGILGLFFTHHDWLSVLMSVLLIICIGLPIVALLYAIIRYSRKGKMISKKAVWITFITWVIAVVATIVIGVYELFTNPQIKESFKSQNIVITTDTDENDEYVDKVFEADGEDENNLDSIQ